MFPASENTGNVPAFLLKLWALVEDQECNDLISWDHTGKSFHVFDQARFSKEVLPHYFKHNNISSFIRQLNMYGFRKVGAVEQGALKVEKDDVEFQHPFFQRGEDSLLENIKRRTANPKNESMKYLHDDVSDLLVDVHTIKGKQENVSNKLDQLRNENEILWREVASLRQKHSKQQQIVNKLIQFLLRLAGSNLGLSGMKRKMQLMIEESGTQPANKIPKLSRPLSITERNTPYTIEPSDALGSEQSGPIIHDVTDVYTTNISPLMTTAVDNMTSSPLQSQMSPQNIMSPVNTLSPVNQNNLFGQIIDASDQFVDTSGQLFDESGQLVDGSGQLVDTSGQLVDGSGQLVDTSGQLVDGSGQLVDTSGQLVDASGQLVSTSGQLVDTSCQLTNTSGQLTDTMNPNILDDTALVTGENNLQCLQSLTSGNTTCTSKAVCPSTSTTCVTCPKTEVNDQLDLMQKDLDGLKEFLSGGQFNLDTNMLLGLFTPESPLPNMPDTLFDAENSLSFGSQSKLDNNIHGNEVMQFNPSDGLPLNLFDLTDEDNNEQNLHDFFNSDGLNTPQLREDNPLKRISTDELD